MTGKLWAKIVFKLRFSVDNLYDNIFLAVQVAIDWWISIILSTRQIPRGIIVANSFSMYQSNRIKKCARGLTQKRAESPTQFVENSHDSTGDQQEKSDVFVFVVKLLNS